jgi:hypothetical protein
MIARALYRIVDEPQPSRLSAMAVRPYFPLLAMMLGGALVGWSWFVVNAYALGSASRRREVALVVVGFLGSAAYFGALFSVLYTRHELPEALLPYAPIPLVVWKLAIGYWLFELQERAAELRSHFGAELRNGAGVVVLAAIARTYIVPESLPKVLHLVFLVLN